MSAPPVTLIQPRARWFELHLDELLQYRSLLGFLAWREVQVRYKQTLIGIGWALAQPLLQMIVFAVFFGRLARVPSDGLPYPVFFLAGLVPWTYFASALTLCTNVVVENQRLITKVYFPRLLLPLSAVLPPLVDLVVGLGLLGIVVLWHGIVPTWTILLLPVFIALALLSALAVGLWAAALNALYRDVRFVLPFMVQLWMFASPVAYASSLVPEKWRWAYALNPMVGVIEGFKWSLTGHGQPPGVMTAVGCFAILLLLLGGLLFFRSKEAKIEDLV